MKAIFVGGKLNGWQTDVENIFKLEDFSGELTEDLSAYRAAGSLVHRAELDNQPIVNGYLSPMWDGGKLRYETQEVYDMMFD